MRTIRSRTAAAATAALLAGLSLSACQGDSEAASGTPSGARPEAGATASGATESGAASSGATANGKPGGTGKTQGEGSGNGQGASGGQGKGAGKGGGTADGSAATCTGANTKAVITKVTRPINHLLLTITNTGSRSCDAYSAPLLRFDDEQSATRIMEDSKPQAVVTLAPGRSAYASILLSGEGGDDSGGRTAQRLEVHFAPRSGSGSTGTPLKLTLPAGTHKDNDAAVTYWQGSASDALQH
ncbi:Protein of unknown function (DUF4232) [Streptomyces sp. SceaMP-e96]|uniref:DUF4232 domain-containing protein n=1 Tax=unclassified Streptomyces TaxID=2593676 RepID=UPI000823A498|nr:MULTISPECIES: DUF4232 domain-containing protein [unclassified Streptomyces]MYT14943.1 DUF4232 domain-containing protein [Streptomyces sp. SID4951]SCK17729.1 Protein of unknown function (DUF4232) [Streptomyces sp. SceaMP-e96]